MNDKQRLDGARAIAHERGDIIERLEARNAALTEKLAAQSDCIIELLTRLSEHAPQTLVSELIKQVALGTKHDGQVRGLSLHVAPKRAGVEL